MFDPERIPDKEWSGIPTVKEASGADISYNMLRGIFGPPDMPKEAVEWYIGFLKKVYETKDFQDYLQKGALKPAFASGSEYVKWVEENDKAPQGIDDERRFGQEVECALSIRMTAAVLMLLSGVVIYDALRLGVGWGSEGPQSGFFPFWLAVLLAVVSIVLFVQALTQPVGRTFRYAGAIRSGSQGSWTSGRLRPHNRSAGPWSGLGLYVAAGLYLGFYMRWVGASRLANGRGARHVVPVITFLIFETWFLVPMPKGPVESLVRVLTRGTRESFPRLPGCGNAV